MGKEPDFHLTAKDHAILQTMLSRRTGAGDAFRELLEWKLRGSTVHLRADIPANVVTMNSRVLYTIDGVTCGPSQIVQSEGPDLPDFALSIHTMTGLALLGLAEKTAIRVPIGGLGSVLTVEEVVHQPEAEIRDRELPARPAPEAAVISFAARRRAAAIPAGPDFDDDDPGPQAA